jgi:iron complex outermembrane receptor protein
LQNIPKSSVRGAEADIQIHSVQGPTLGAAITYLDATKDRFTGVNVAGVTATFDGVAAPYTPKWSLGTNVNYDFGLTDTWNGFVGGQINYRSSTTATVGSPPGFGIPSYTLLDLQGGVESQNGKWRVMAWGKNVANKVYFNNVVQQPDSRTRYTGQPVTYGVTVSYKY